MASFVISIEKIIQPISCIAGASLLVFSSGAMAQANNWPERSVKVINPFPAGGASDTLTRIMSDQLQQKLGKPFVVENKTGSAGNIGMEAGAKAPPDGYTITSATIGTLSVNQYLFKQLPYEPEGMTYVSTFWANCNVVMVSAQHNTSKTLKEFIEWSKAKPKGISFGSSGVGTTPHLAGELFHIRTGIPTTHIPTRGGPQTVALLLSGELDVSIDNIASYASFLASGQVRGLATTCPERWPRLPDIPTMAEAGMPDFVITSWGAFVMPAGTPPAIAEKVSKAMSEVAADPAIQKRFLDAGAKITSTTPAQTSAFVANERKKMSEVVRLSGAKAE
ncbi:MAG: tripartite tricarboxylate transporter substrate binding protein [Betaproteobacteria bacterium]|nr:tripartite tricarboxylate transporter substrate binding protein [Betaproteobacteria bacterium]